MPRLTFWQIFKLVDQNTLQVLRKIKVGTIELGEGSTIARGTIIAGLDFFKYINLSADVEGEVEGDAWVLKKVVYLENDS